MNFLGHFYTSADDPAVMAGSFLGDFLKGSVEDHPPELSRGLRLHRAVDAIGDRLQGFRDTCRLLRPSCDRYARVVADIVGDHLLASSWRKFATISLAQFTVACHGVLEEWAGSFGPVPRSVATRLMRERWLESYASLEGLEESLRRFQRRIRTPLAITEVIDTVAENRETLVPGYRSFISELEANPRIISLRPPRPGWVILSRHGA